ncbi:type I restriction enzyme endonuclease domain-containing protein [Streptomyces sp. NPDC059909]|uniref:type I restriction enzyme endonuclease domain-containing protein n=1 Tax=Streptomyces sp. NPDC059909 TaxID=3346998 RepID=UPI00364733D1
MWTSRTTFSERLQDLMARYMRQQYTSAELIAKLVEMAKEAMDDARRGEKFEPPPLDSRELAFYDAMADHGTARSVMGDEVLAGIARELVAEVRSKLKPDWTPANRSAPASAAQSASSPATGTRRTRSPLLLPCLWTVQRLSSGATRHDRATTPD